MTKRRRVVCLGGLLLLLLAACSPAEPWRHPVLRGHPLVGRVWDQGGARFVTAPELARALAGADFVLLGEKHDNADHHRLQAKMVRSLAVAGREPVVAFEMITSDAAPALARHLAEHPRDARGLGPAVTWEKRGWPPWEDYRAIAQAALDHGLGIAAAGLPRALLRRVAAEGMTVLDRGLRSRLGLEAPLEAATREAMAEELRLSHCDLLPESALPGMVRAQRVLDAVMADNLVRAASDGGVLVTGAGHARKDRGVPAILARLRPGARVTSLAFMEVERDLVEPAGYARLYGAETLPFDYVWFTPRVDEDDPCEKFRKNLK